MFQCLGAGQKIADLCLGIEQGAGQRQKRLPFRGQADGALGAIEEKQAIRLFQCLHVQCDGRLCDVQRVGGLAEAEFARDGMKGAQLDIAHEQTPASLLYKLLHKKILFILI